jgi:hypothetical protein
LAKEVLGEKGTVLAARAEMDERGKARVTAVERRGGKLSSLPNASPAS